MAQEIACNAIRCRDADKMHDSFAFLQFGGRVNFRWTNTVKLKERSYAAFNSEVGSHIAFKIQDTFDYNL